MTEVLTHLNRILFNRTYSQKPVYVYTLSYPALSLLCYTLLLKGQMFRWSGHLVSWRMGADIHEIINNT